MSRGPKQVRMALLCGMAVFWTLLPGVASAAWTSWWNGYGPMPSQPAKISAHDHWEYATEARKVADSQSTTYACNNYKWRQPTSGNTGYGTSVCTNQSINPAGHYDLFQGFPAFTYFDIATSQMNPAYQYAYRDQ